MLAGGSGDDLLLDEEEESAGGGGDEGADSVTLPQKALNQIIKESCPTMRVSNDCRDFLSQSCHVFIRRISAEAQRLSANDQRKTICHEHLLQAMKTVGLPDVYLEVCNSVLDECTEQTKRRLRRKNSRLEKCGVPEEELYRQQQELIDQARQEQAQKDAEQIALIIQQQDSSAENGDASSHKFASITTESDLDEDYDAADEN